MKTLIRQNPPRRRVTLTIPEESTTDQTLLNELSMASIKNKLEKHIPITNTTNDNFYSLKPLQYTNLQDALNFHEYVHSHFNSLPVELRKEMGNNIHNFEPFISDPKNQEKLIKFGLIKLPDASNNQIVNSVNELKELFRTTASDKQKPV